LPITNSKPVLLIRGLQNQADADALDRLGISSEIDPYLQIMPTADPTAAERMLKSLETADWLVAASSNGLRFWGQLVGDGNLKRAIALAQERGVRFAAVGETTALLLESLGATEVLIPDSAYSQELAEILVKETLGVPAVAVIPGGNLTLKTLSQELTKAGWQLDCGEVYLTSTAKETPDSAAGVARGEYSAVVFRSPSAAQAFYEHCGPSQLPAICGGQTTANLATDLGLNVVRVAKTPSSSSIALAVQQALSNLSGVSHAAH
jgi:uroporphyrinogen-III synthase